MLLSDAFSDTPYLFIASAFEEIGWFRCEIPASAMTRRTGQHGTYYDVEFDIVIKLGTVEIKAHVEWEQNVRIIASEEDHVS